MACQFSGGLHITQNFFTNEKEDDVESISHITEILERVGNVS